MLNDIIRYMLEFRDLLKKYRERINMTKASLADKIGVSFVVISTFESLNSKNRYKYANFQHFQKLCEVLKLNNQEKLEMAISCIYGRISDDNRQYIDYINKNKSNMDVNFRSDESIKNMIKERFEPLFNDKKAVELLYDTDVLNVLKKIHDLPKDKRNKKINLIAQILDD